MQLANTRIPAGLIALMTLTAPGLTCASAADYYAGKSIDLLIGAPPGGGYDIYARTLARHYGRHIPGQPSIVAKNMPGAGSARAAGFISTMAPQRRDGDRRHHARRGDGTAARREGRGAVRPDQGALSRHRQQRHARLRRAPGLQDQDFRRRARAEGGLRRRLDQQFDPRIRLHAQENCGRAIRRGFRLQRHRRDRAGDGARRDRRRVRLGLGKLEVAAPRLDSRRQDQRAAAGRSGTERRAHAHGRPLGVQIREP